MITPPKAKAFEHLAGQWCYFQHLNSDYHLIPLNRPVHLLHDPGPKCWCQPYVSKDETDSGGGRLWIHRELQ